MSRAKRFLLVLALVLGVVAGCGGQATGGSVTTKDDSVTIKGKEGESLTISSKVPDELKSFPIPAGFQATGGALLSPAGAEKLATASWKGKSTVDKVVEFYKKNSPGQGWTGGVTFAYSSAAQFKYTKEPDQTLIATISQSGDEIEISVMAGKASR